MLGFFVSVPLPIFNRNQGEIARADAEREKAERSVRAGETDVAGEVAAAYQEFESARALLADIERDLLDADAGSAGQRRPTSIRPARRRCSTCSTPSGPSTTPWTPTTPRRLPIAAPRPSLSLAVNKDVLP